MSRWDFDLNVNADEIVVTVPSTNYTVTYYKPDNSPQLLARKFPSKDDSAHQRLRRSFSPKLGGLRSKRLGSWGGSHDRTA